MIKDALMNIMGLDRQTSKIVELLLVKLDKIDQVEQHLLSLSDDVIAAVKHMDGIISHPDDPDNSDMSIYYNRHETNGWSPDINRNKAQLSRSLLPDVSDEDQYEVTDVNDDDDEDQYEVTESKMTMLEYITNLNEKTNAQVDNDLINMSDKIDDNIDKNTQKRIDAYIRQGNKEAANRLRTRSLRRANMSNTKPKSPTQAMVDVKKRELAKALRTNARHEQDQNQEK